MYDDFVGRRRSRRWKDEIGIIVAHSRHPWTITWYLDTIYWEFRNAKDAD